MRKVTDNIKQTPDNDHNGCILEADIDYPEHLHDIHKHLSMPTLYNKQRYVIRYRDLTQALKQGRKISKVHQILEFKQLKWMKRYIDFEQQNS